MKKLLVLGIIILFIGLAFIPSFNAVSISKDIEETNPVVDDSEEDCIECKSDNNPLAEKLLNRLEKNEVLSNVIDPNNHKEDLPICDYILESFWHYVDLMDYYGDESHKYQNGSLMYRYYKLLCYMCFYTSFIYLCSAMLLDCDMGPYYP